MTSEQLKHLKQDPDGLLSYEFLANNIGQCEAADLDALIDNMCVVDLTGQFLASAARYLHAIDPEGYAEPIRRLVAGAIDKDRGHNYLPELVISLYGCDYADRADVLCNTDDNFRRLYKRLCPASSI